MNRLTDEQRQAVEQHHGVLQVDGGEGKYIIMSIDLYRDMMGVGTDEQLAASVAALEKSMQEVRAGQTRPLTDALDDLGRKHEVQG